jgi:hypothetical protein
MIIKQCSCWNGFREVHSLEYGKVFDEVAEKGLPVRDQNNGF